MKFYSLILFIASASTAASQTLPESSTVNLVKRDWLERHRDRVNQRRINRIHRFVARNAPIPVAQTQQVVTTVDGVVVPGPGGIVPGGPIVPGPVGPVIPPIGPVVPGGPIVPGPMGAVVPPPILPGGPIGPDLFD